jgi:hypothetical protein
MSSKGIGSSSNCNVDVACHPEYSNEAKGVALVLLANGDEWCSGSLLMSTDMLFKPYFLTAFHCIDTNFDGSLSTSEKTNAQNWMFKFNFKRATCGGDSIMTSYTYNGSIFRSAFCPTDFALLEINQNLTSNSNLAWLGWDRSGDIPLCGVGIHHPAGDVMKISIEDDAFTTIKWVGVNSSGNFDHWGVDYDVGIVENRIVLDIVCGESTMEYKSQIDCNHKRHIKTINAQRTLSVDYERQKHCEHKSGGSESDY